ncbi:hypothetical protein HOY82DRAFT_537774 [Tuber indicum]|nr:hypothetical protein HOY82DRAFT_537774 [Tuber indicum]
MLRLLAKRAQLAQRPAAAQPFPCRRFLTGGQLAPVLPKAGQGCEAWGGPESKQHGACEGGNRLDFITVKSDFKEATRGVPTQIGAGFTRIERKIAERNWELKSDVDQKIRDLRHEMSRNHRDLILEVSKNKWDLKSDMSQNHHKLRREIMGLETKVEVNHIKSQGELEMIRWPIPFLVGGVFLTLGICAFLR